MNAERTFLILFAYLCGIFASVLQGSPATFVFFACAFALDLLWEPWFIIPLVVVAAVAYAHLRDLRIDDSSARLVVLGMTGAMTAAMWHQKTWFCASVRGAFPMANLGTPFLFGFFSGDGYVDRRSTAYRIVHTVVSLQLLWLLSPYHDVGGLHDTNVKILAGTALLSMFLRHARKTLIVLFPTLLFVLYMSYLSPTSNPSSNRGDFPGGAKLTTLYFFLLVVHGLCT